MPLVRQGAQRLAQHGKPVRLHRDLTCAGPHHRPTDADPVSDVEVAECVVVVTKHVASEHRLHRARPVHDVPERHPTHAPHRCDATADRHLLHLGLPLARQLRRLEVLHRLPGGVRPVVGTWVGVDPLSAESRELLQSYPHKLV